VSDVLEIENAEQVSHILGGITAFDRGLPPRMMAVTSIKQPFSDR